MELQEKSKILSQLSRLKGEKAEAALTTEAKKSAKILLSDNDFRILADVLDEMEIYGFRVPHLITIASKQFLDRLLTETISYSFDGSAPPSSYSDSKFQEMLVAKTMKLLDSIRYHAVAEVVELVLPFAASPVSTISKAATDLLIGCAKFDLDIYYGGEGYRGIGAAPQTQLLGILEKYEAPELLKNFNGVTAILNELVSPDMRGDYWDFDKVTLKFGSVPVTEEIEAIRTRTIALIYKIYGFADKLEQKRSLLASLFSATSTPSHEKSSEQLIKLINKNTLEILDFLKSIIPEQEMQIIQKIEHDTYWLHYHATFEETKTKAIEIRDLIESNKEYLIYKNLVGFEGIFDEWEYSRKDRIDFQAIDDGRTKKIVEYVQSINLDNWSVWRARIIDYAKTDSDDLATFPKFYEFLEKFAIAHPTLALSLLEQDFDAVKRFTIPIYRGLWTSPQQHECKKFLLSSIANERDIIGATKLFLSVNELDYDIIGSIMERATENEDQRALTELVGVACANYSINPQNVTERIFRPAITTLNRLGSAHWIENVWFNKDAKRLVTHLGAEDRNLVYVALTILRDISYRAEEILISLVAVDPEGVIEMFGDRIKNDERSKDYEAIPFKFFSLQEGLAAHSELLIQKVRSWYRNNDPLFQFKGGKFLAEIYPAFDDQFGGQLIQLVRNGTDEDIRFVIAVMRNYEGEVFLHRICREIVVRKHRDDQMMSDVQLVLYSTGVVSGEYGHAEAYEKKILEMKSWLDDSESQVVNFAIKFIDMLKRSAVNERERADEQIVLRKHRFGHRN